MGEEELEQFADLRLAVSEAIKSLVEAMDTHDNLDDVTMLLCAAGAACGDLELSEELINAVVPIMERAHARLQAMENN